MADHFRVIEESNGDNNNAVLWFTCLPAPISGERATNITTSSAVIRWETAQARDSYVYYNLAGQPPLIVSDGAFVTSHS
ncbi:MAG: hypothetical protein V1708_05880, partial [Candidatus Micrarchaeota archaeon]